MIEETVTITSTEGDMAVVEAQRKSTCGGCSVQSGCGTSLLAKAFGGKRNCFEVKNPIGAVRGEQVVIGIPESSLPKASFLFYLVPILLLLSGSIIAQTLAEKLGVTFMEPMTIFGGLLGLLTGLAGVRIFATRANQKHQYQAVVLRKANGTNHVFLKAE